MTDLRTPDEASWLDRQKPSLIEKLSLSLVSAVFVCWIAREIVQMAGIGR
ncbi:MAG TPA: hypothetical protein VGV37_06155 [Aliidongia sp.]|nr:hypothetical protein [Aliidongia sp.]HEV2674107.1 hypothetical protein [Aliidongia sp.]